MNELLKLVLKLSVSGSVFFLLFFILSYFTKKIFSAKWHLFMLKLNMIFYLIPITLIYNSIPKHSKGIGIGRFNIIFKPMESSNYFADIIGYLFYIWLIGVSILIIWNLYCYKRFIKSIKESYYSDKNLEEAIYNCKVDLNIATNIKVKKSYLVSCPMIIGIIKPTIIFPSNIEYSSKLIPVIMHELIHYKRNDLLFKLLQLIITVINWFNPIVYIMNNSFEKWCEISCDEIVAENMSYAERKEYGNTILSIIENVNDVPNFLCFYLCGEKKYIKRRLLNMLNTKKTSNFNRVFGGLLVSAMILGGSAISATATTTNENVKNFKIEANDESIRSLLEERVDEFRNEINLGEAVRGAVVVVDTKTGEVLGTSSYNAE
ncbi:MULTISPECIES: M56 family metallopeptidase [unclassified Clostridium]|uniref:M56 family metallopeptidase n=1 Tax=unclassified Clostridium TaxID=2614128 RepID=UPI001C8B4623|nr:MULTISPECIES: M56 family metallopeptidase [unclassified Clostridium]MBX9136787.1 M56 family metallopeptidase [Clostridium sp. K12(2020)]MBX9143597.1 M56 family metallopeptidase [Clostridium sp. K13]MDU2288904.1 M56 family metallopeptidase [Clostridium celatum]MDU4325926.1 M56 family metallopeptidase [Clostridium celatum]